MGLEEIPQSKFANSTQFLAKRTHSRVNISKRLIDQRINGAFDFHQEYEVRDDFQGFLVGLGKTQSYLLNWRATKLREAWFTRQSQKKWASEEGNAWIANFDRLKLNL